MFPITRYRSGAGKRYSEGSKLVTTGQARQTFNIHRMSSWEDWLLDGSVSSDVSSSSSLTELMLDTVSGDTRLLQLSVHAGCAVLVDETTVLPSPSAQIVCVRRCSKKCSALARDIRELLKCESFDLPLKSEAIKSLRRPQGKTVSNIPNGCSGCGPGLR